MWYGYQKPVFGRREKKQVVNSFSSPYVVLLIKRSYFFFYFYNMLSKYLFRSRFATDTYSLSAHNPTLKCNSGVPSEYFLKTNSINQFDKSVNSKDYIHCKIYKMEIYLYANIIDCNTGKNKF